MKGLIFSLNILFGKEEFDEPRYIEKWHIETRNDIDFIIIN